MVALHNLSAQPRLPETPPFSSIMPGNFLSNRNRKRAYIFQLPMIQQYTERKWSFRLEKTGREDQNIFPKQLIIRAVQKTRCAPACSWFGLHRVLVSGYPVGIAWHHIPKDRKMQTSFHNGTESGNLLPLRQSVIVYGNRARWKTIVCAAMWLTFNSCKATVSNVAGAFEISR